MEKYAELISILLQHSQRFLDFWNIQILVALGVLGFVFSNLEVVSKRSVRMIIILIFVFIAAFSVFSLSAHQQREEKLYAAIEYHTTATPGDFTPADIAYLDSLRPTPFTTKIGALILADVLLIAVIWISPKMKE
jgi:hypothetical protein